MAEIPKAVFEDRHVMNPCPACGKPIVARTACEVEMFPTSHPRDGADSTLNARVKIVGLFVQHDCMPRVTR